MEFLKDSITVVIPCFNSADTLERAVNSVISQTLLPDRLILVDDASTDATSCYLNNLCKRILPFEIKVISSKKNIGASCARNLGLRSTSTKYVAFLDADDSWHSQKLELQYRWMEAHPEAKLLAHQCVVDQEKDVDKHFLQQQFDDSVCYFSFKQLLMRTRFSTPSVMIRYDPELLFSSDLKYAEDYECWLRFAWAGNGVYVSDLPLARLYKARFGASGLSSHIWRMQFSVMTVYWKMYKSKRINFLFLFGLEVLSILAFIRRFFISKLSSRDD